MFVLQIMLKNAGGTSSNVNQLASDVYRTRKAEAEIQVRLSYVSAKASYAEATKGDNFFHIKKLYYAR